MTNFKSSSKNILMITVAGLTLGCAGMISQNMNQQNSIAYAANTQANGQMHTKRAKVGYISHHRTGTLRLSRPLLVENVRQGDQRTKIPSGQTLHYRKQNYGVDVWNKKYPRNGQHQYEADGIAAKQQLNHDAKNNKVNKKPQGMPNVDKKPKKQVKPVKKAQKPVTKSKLPRTSDNTLNNNVLIMALIGAVSSIAYIFIKLTPKLFKKED